MKSTLTWMFAALVLVMAPCGFADGLDDSAKAYERFKKSMANANSAKPKGKALKELEILAYPGATKVAIKKEVDSNSAEAKRHATAVSAANSVKDQAKQQAWVTKDSPDKVLNFYASQYAAQGLKNDNPIGDSTYKMVTYRDPDVLHGRGSIGVTVYTVKSTWQTYLEPNQTLPDGNLVLVTRSAL